MSDARNILFPDPIHLRRESMKRLLVALLLAGFLVPASHAADESSPVPPPKIKVGDMAPDFTLEDQNGKKVSLSEFRGKKNVALAFYIFAFTGG
jgi:cytochrome oxidase Cu insertion factor (SCO1/SenC/PrrC family)